MLRQAGSGAAGNRDLPNITTPRKREHFAIRRQGRLTSESDWLIRKGR
jgi:hypothetical protein